MRYLFGLFAIASSVVHCTTAFAIDEQAILARLEAVEKENLALKRRIAQIAHTKPVKPKHLGKTQENQSNERVAPQFINSHSEPQPNTPQSSFSGLYAGLTTGGAFTLNSPSSYTDSRLRGYESGVVFGYNAVSNGLLLGFEAKLDLGSQRSILKEENSWNSALPKEVFSVTCYDPSCIQFYRNYPGSSEYFGQTYRYNAKLSAGYNTSISARAGVIINDMLIFSRAGLGFQQIELTRDGVSIIDNCVSPAYSSAVNENNVRVSLTGCDNHSYDTSYLNIKRSVILPYSVLAFGVEKNIDRYFIRGEFGFNYYVFAPNAVGITSGFGKVVGSLGAGIRF